ncbi:MAG: hypothetical protein ACI9U2_001192 [Bradymonadia bacterium]
MTKTSLVLGVLLALTIGCDDGDPEPLQLIVFDGSVGAGGGGAGGGGAGGGGAGGGGAGGQGGAGQGGEGGGAGGQGGQGGEGGGAAATEDTDALCSDGLDNDDDGVVDCEDFDCSRNNDITVCEPVCQPDCAGRTCGPDSCGGACGPGCGAGEVCADGQCSAEGCPDGTFECGAVCSRLTDDPDNCGSCGAVCEQRPSALRQCISAECYLNCPGMEGEARSLDFENDPNNCGRCGTVCPSADGGRATCQAGECGNPCPNGQSVCDGQCVNLDFDEAHCGACGDTCTDGMQCNNGSCACPNGRDDLQSDTSNCGECGNFCSFPAFAGGTPICEQGECAIDCDERFVCAAECSDLQDDVDHCGACDTPCPGNVELPPSDGTVRVTGTGCESASCTYTVQRAERLSFGDNDCGRICARRGLECDARVLQLRTCTTNRGQGYEMQNASPGVGCFMYYSDREQSFRFAIAPNCDSNIRDFDFRDRQNFRYEGNAANCNCVTP